MVALTAAKDLLDPLDPEEAVMAGLRPEMAVRAAQQEHRIIVAAIRRYAP